MTARIVYEGGERAPLLENRFTVVFNGEFFHGGKKYEVYIAVSFHAFS